MGVKVISEQEVIREAAEVLLKHMEPEKAARFWTIWQPGSGNYLAIREQLLAGESVKTVFDKIKGYQEEHKNT